MNLVIDTAAPDDIAAIVTVHRNAANRLTSEFGVGPWSSRVSDREVARALRESRVLVARHDGRVIGTLRLQARKPWAIDRAFFSPANAPLYLVGMAVAPAQQRQGVGRRLLDEAVEVARAWPRDALRLDAWNAPAGAGAFYARCGWDDRGCTTYRGSPLRYFERRLVT